MRSKTAAALTAILVAAGSLLAAGTAVAAVPDSTPSPASTADLTVTHPEDDFLGSQVRKHQPGSPHVVAPGVTQTPGLDVSSWQGNVNWSSVAANGARFAYVKATEGTSYTNPYFAQQYNGSYNVGLIRGAYHFAIPSSSGGATQADYFIARGGGWSRDGRTLPGLLDIEWNPYGASCYGYSQAGMAGWIRAFSDRYAARTGRYPVIYSATSWWNQCVGTAAAFGSINPLFIANYNGGPGPMPYNWPYHTIWQWSDSGTFPGDQDLFNGDFSRVQALANG